MSVVVLTSAAGAPGVTTTALGVTLAWPRDVVFIDADRNGGQAVLAGFLQGYDAHGRGVARLSDAEAAMDPDRLLDQCVQLAVDDRRRLLLPGFLRPASAASFEPMWWSFARGIRRLAEHGYDAVVDAGRIGVGLPTGVLDVADVVVVVVRSTLRSLAGVRVHLDKLAEQARDNSFDYGLVVVGPGRPYTVDEIAAQFQWPVLATITWDPDAAGVLSDGTHYRRFDRSLFQRSVQMAASCLGARDLVRWT